MLSGIKLKRSFSPMRIVSNTSPSVGAGLGLVVAGVMAGGYYMYQYYQTQNGNCNGSGGASTARATKTADPNIATMDIQ